MFSTSTSFLNPGNSAGNGSGSGGSSNPKGNSAGNGSGSGGSSNPNGNSAGNGSGSVAPNDGQATQEAFDRALEERERIGVEYVRENGIHSEEQDVPEEQVEWIYYQIYYQIYWIYFKYSFSFHSLFR